MIENVRSCLDQEKIEYEYDVLLSDITKISGNAYCEYYCRPNSVIQLRHIISFCIKQNIVFDVVGSLTNTYFLDNYRSKLIIATGNVKEINFRKDVVVCSCGVNLSKLSRACIRKGIAGYEGFIGVPGTVGAAVINNTGAFQSSMHLIVKRVTILTLENKIVHLSNADLKYETRSSVLKSSKNNGIVLSVELCTNKRETSKVLRNRMIVNRNYRRKHIDGHRKSLGSIFVSSSLHYLTSNFRMRLLLKKICYAPFKFFLKDLAKLKQINTFLFFLFVGAPKLAKHCDSLNRFCWRKNTTEKDFMNYLEVMQSLANNRLKIEIDIKGN